MENSLNADEYERAPTIAQCWRNNGFSAILASQLPILARFLSLMMRNFPRMIAPAVQFVATDFIS